MVLFNEAQTTLLLDLYLHFRSNPQNLTSGGVLLKMHARDELTRALNRFFKREAPWTESQVTVKFKNLRSEYIELKWLAAQPGFQLDGQGVADEWWAEIKARRPKVHAFKGKLPWPFFHKMAVIVDNAAAPAGVADPRSAQRISHLLAEMAADGANNNGTSGPNAASAPPPRSYANNANNTNNNGSVDGYPDANGVGANNATNTNNGTMELVAPTRPVAAAVPQAPVALAGKRPRDVAAGSASGSRRPRRRLAELSADERVRQQSLATSVEHGSKAAADMARGFNDLVAMYQQQTAKCAHAETAAAVAGLGGDDSLDVQEQRQVLVSLAASLEKSAQATAEMAKGYRDLVAFFIQESDDATP